MKKLELNWDRISFDYFDKNSETHILSRQIGLDLKFVVVQYKSRIKWFQRVLEPYIVIDGWTYSDIPIVREFKTVCETKQYIETKRSIMPILEIQPI